MTIVFCCFVVICFIFSLFLLIELSLIEITILNRHLKINIKCNFKEAIKMQKQFTTNFTANVPDFDLN